MLDKRGGNAYRQALPNDTGGEGGIRTHGSLSRSTVFETAPIDHSGTSPELVFGCRARHGSAVALDGFVRIGGERGIRTLGRLSPTHTFQACSLNHSDISPGYLADLLRATFAGNAFKDRGEPSARATRRRSS